MDQFFSLDRALKAFPKILSSLGITFEIVIIGITAGLILGTVLATIRLFKVPVLHQLTSVYISFMRGTPIIIQLYIVYYGLPMLASNLFGVDVFFWNKQQLALVIITFALNEAAFLSEIIRGSILTVPKLQTEAGYTVGLTYWQTFIHIIVPQAIRSAIPAFGVDLVGLFQGTSLAFLLGVVDVIGRARIIGGNTAHYLDVYVDAAIIFIAISALIEFVFHRIQKRGDTVYGKIRI